MASPEPARWRATAFGLELLGDFEAPGLAGRGGGARSGPSTTLALASPGELDDATGAFLFDHRFYGRHRVSSDGTHVVCAPPADLPAWLWQRFLVGQLLPLASLLHGHEPLHASAVGIDGQAVLLMGTSGAGKSSVALSLVAAGARFLADDVSALELRDGAVLAHPGPGLASIEADQLARMPAEASAGWTRLGSHEGEVRVSVGGVPGEALPVAAVYVLTRRADIESLDVAAPSLGVPETLLGGTFNAYVQEPARLSRLLDLSARLAETAPVREVRIPMSIGPAESAEAIAAVRREPA